MANISILSRMVNGVQRNVDLSANTLVVSSLMVGGASGTTLTKSILDSLIAFPGQLASSTVGSAGTTLIGDNNSYTHITPATLTLKATLTAIDAALGSATNAVDNTFYIANATDLTKHLAFSAANISTGTTRTLTMPDFNVNLGALTDANIAAAAAIARTKLSALTANRAMVTDASGFDSVSTTTATELGYVSGVTSAIQTQINNLSSSIQNFEWQPSVLTASPTPPGSPVTNGRYLVLGTGTGTFAGHDNQIAVYNGTTYSYITVTTGTFVSADDQPNQLYLFGGATWTAKSFESTTASTGLTKVGFDIQLANATGTAITVTAGALAVLVDGTSINISGNNLQIAPLGVTTAKLAPTSVTAAKLGSDVAGAGLTGGNGSALAVNPDNVTIEINTNAVRIKTTAYDQKSIVSTAGAAASVASAPLARATMVAGEAIAANTLTAVRWAINGETAGRVYKADKDATSTQKYAAIGLALSVSAVSAGGNVDVIMLGAAPQGTSDTPFTTAQVGLEVFVGTTGALILGAALASTVGEAAYCIGVVQSTTSIWVDFKNLRGIA